MEMMFAGISSFISVEESSHVCNEMYVMNPVFIGHRVLACAQVGLSASGTSGTIIGSVHSDTAFPAQVLAITKVL